MLLSLSQIL